MDDDDDDNNENIFSLAENKKHRPKKTKLNIPTIKEVLIYNKIKLIKIKNNYFKLSKGRTGYS